MQIVFCHRLVNELKRKVSDEEQQCATLKQQCAGYERQIVHMTQVASQREIQLGQMKYSLDQKDNEIGALLATKENLLTRYNLV